MSSLCGPRRGSEEAVSRISGSNQLEHDLKRIHAKSIFDTPAHKDLPRLAARITIVSSVSGAAPPENDVNGTSPSAATAAPTTYAAYLSRGVSLSAEGTSGGGGEEEKVTAETSSGEGPVEGSVVHRVCLELAAALDPDPASLEAARVALDNYDRSVAGGLEALNAATQLFQDLGGDKRPLVRVLKFVNQGVVLGATQIIREQIPALGLTKDVRTPDGWQIRVDITEGTVQVAHRRKEQSMDQFGDSTNHFEYSWEASATFTRDLSDLNAAFLRITSLDLAPTMEPARQQELRGALLSGKLML